MYFAGVETGGTSIKVAIAKHDPGNIIEKKSFVTSKTNPTETISQVIAWLKDRKFSSLGIASFGPFDLNKSSPTYGFITSTPKLAWQMFDLLKPFRDAFEHDGFPEIAFDTDVNAPALSELEFGGHLNVGSVAYITCGTGIGVGLVVGNHAVHGLLHPEGGHILVPIHEKDRDFKGVCPFHPTCLESMATSVALAKRKGIQVHELIDLPDDDEIWDLEAYYLASLCTNLLYLTSVEVIVCGGGVFERKVLLDKVRNLTKKNLNGYLKHEKIDSMDKLIVDSKFKSDSGIVGALALAFRQLKVSKL